MGYRNLSDCIADLEATGQLVRISREIDPELEAGAVQRRVYQAQGPAVLFTNVRGCRFPMLGNLFGTLERARFLFRDTLKTVQRLAELKINPTAPLKHPGRYLGTPAGALHLLPRKVRCGPILAHTTTLDCLPQLKSWPEDGGAFITLPQVYSESPGKPGLRRSNLGMYRVQISGGSYRPNEEVGLHYQIHRGLGVHHAEALEQGIPLQVNIFVGGPPSLTVAAVMPLPEGLPELAFAGLLGGRRVAMVPAARGLAACRPKPISSSRGTLIDPDELLPEGPFGDHLGYYSLAHDFPGVAGGAGLSTARTPSGPLPPSAGLPRKTPASAP